MPIPVTELARFLETFAPPELAEEWDNVGLLVGDPAQPVARVMTCLTLTPATVAEAVAERAELVVAHHPLPFKPLKRITTETTAGRLLLDLIRGGVAVYSPHTAFDSTVDGINQHLSAKLGLTDMAPLVPSRHATAGQLGAGRFGRLPKPCSLADMAQHVKNSLGVKHVQVVGAFDRRIERVAVGCGSAGGFLEAARAANCDLFITGETNLHTCYEAEATGIGLLLAGHYATERFHLEHLAQVLQEQFPQLRVWASRQEREPTVWL
jgi:dinuclear metal center YbgI/SA1388 family protein